MSGAVGSMPSLTRNGRRSSSFRSSSPFGSTSTALRVRSATPIATSLLPDGVELLDLDRHDLVVQALQQQKWIGDRVGVSDRGTVAIQIDRFRPRPNEVVVVVRLELVRLRVEGHEI